MLRRHTLRSYVQVGEVHGSVAIGPRLLAFGGAGLRQHSWGVRDWGASDEATQCFASFGAPTSGEAARSPGRGGVAPTSTQVWLHSARFPWLTLAGGFVQRAAGRVAVRELGVRPTRLPGRAPSHVGFHVEAPGGALALEMETLAELGLEMDGRGHLDLALCRVHGAGEGWALVISQRRLLRRAAAPEE